VTETEIGRGVRLLVRPQGTPVVALAPTGRRGWMVMRSGGGIATIEPGRLEAWKGATWTGPPFEWAALPLGIRLTVEYFEAKSRLMLDPANMSDRETAGLLIVTYGLDRATEVIDRAGFDPAVASLLREARGHS